MDAVLKATEVRKWRRYEDIVANEHWFATAPWSWRAMPLKHIFYILNGATPKSSESRYWDGDIAWATPEDLGDLQGDTLMETRRQITREGYESCGALIAPAGSVVLSTRAPIGHVAIAGRAMCTNQGCRTLVFKASACVRFFYYVLLTARPEIQSHGRGSTFLELGRDELASVSLPVPPLPEQRAIAAFLDRETARIDALIGHKQRLIDLLEEKRQAVISHAVTKGLDPNVKMKDSGIRFVGDVPIHWSICSFGLILEYISYGFTNPMPVSEDGPYMLTANDIANGEVQFATARRTTQEAFEKHLTAKSRPKKDDLLLTKDGTLGRTALCDGTPCCINQSVALLRFKRKHQCLPFIHDLLRSLPYQENIKFDSGGTTIKHVYITRIVKMRVALPPVNEQRAISDFCGAKRSQLCKAIAKVDQGIEHLREYRSGLISAAVTGQIDVRDEVQLDD